MSSNTPNLGLLKKDPMVDGNETFNIETMLNENWDKVDEAVGNIKVPDASLTEKGIVQLSNATNGTRENVAATEKAVNDVTLVAKKDLKTHSDAPVVGEQGIHGLRVNNENLEYYTGSRWIRIINDNPNPERVHLNVDNINGSDDNDGKTQATAFRTIKRAVREAVKYYKDIVWIYCATTVNEKIELKGITNLTMLQIFGYKQGNPSGLGSPMAKTPQITISECTSTISVNNFEVDKNLEGYEYGITIIERCSSVFIGEVRNINVGGNPAFRVESTTYAGLSSCEVSNRGKVIEAHYGGVVAAHNLIGTNNSVGLNARFGATILKMGTQASATTAEQVSDGGVIK